MKCYLFIPLFRLKQAILKRKTRNNKLIVSIFFTKIAYCGCKIGLFSLEVCFNNKHNIAET